MGNNKTIVANGLGSRSEQIDRFGKVTNATFHDADGGGLGGLLCKRRRRRLFIGFVRG